MEPEGSLPQTQEPATCPYAQPDQSSPYPHIPLLGDPWHEESSSFGGVDILQYGE